MRVVVVGASVAGISAVERLRSCGFEGEIVLVGEESGRPYDRPPLSKQFLLGEMDTADVALRAEGALDALGVTHLDGRRATGVDVEGKTLQVEGEAPLSFDGLILATGSKARDLPGLGDLDGAHLLRTIEDATGIREELRSARSVIVIGAGFIGLEAASVAAAQGKSTTVVDVAPQPMGRLLSPAVGRLFADLHRAHGVVVRCGVEIEAVEGEERFSSVVIDGGERLEADLLIVGVGASPNTAWLDGGDLSIDNGIVCDDTLRAAPGVYAAGDVARWPHPNFGTIRVEHWSTAVDHARVAAENLVAELAGEAPPARADDVPYFWSDQHGVKIQMAGWSPAAEEVVAMVEPGRLLLLFGRGRGLVAAMAWNWPRALALHRRMIAAGKDFGEVVAAAPGERIEVADALGRFDPDAVETGKSSQSGVLI